MSYAWHPTLLLSLHATDVCENFFYKPILCKFTNLLFRCETRKYLMLSRIRERKCEKEKGNAVGVCLRFDLAHPQGPFVERIGVVLDG